MKKIYTLIVCFLPILALAQPTITQSDLPVAGTVWIMANNNSFSGSILAGGSNQTWDYTSLTNNQTDTTAFLSVVGTPYVDSFPSATTVTYDPSDTSWEYLTSNSSGFYLNGGVSNGGYLKFTPPVLYVPVPSTYTDSTKSTSRMVIDTSEIEGSDTIPGQFILNISTKVVTDGWGTLKLPSGTFPNTLREKVTTITTDSILVEVTPGNYIFFTKISSQTVTYRWLRDGGSGSSLLLTIDADSSGTVAHTSQYYLADYVLSTKDIAVIQNNSLHVYPNPASDNVHFDLQGTKSENGVIKVYNSIGQQIESIEVQGISYFDLPVDKFANGIYYYSLISDNEMLSGNFSVAH